MLVVFSQRNTLQTLVFWLTHLRVRAQEFKVALPLFMAKRKSDKGKDQSALKRQRGDVQHNRHRGHQAYVMQPSSTSSSSVVPVSGHNSSSVNALGKGRHKQRKSNWNTIP